MREQMKPRVRDRRVERDRVLNNLDRGLKRTLSDADSGGAKNG